MALFGLGFIVGCLVGAVGIGLEFQRNAISLKGKRGGIDG